MRTSNGRASGSTVPLVASVPSNTMIPCTLQPCFVWHFQMMLLTSFAMFSVVYMLLGGEPCEMSLVNYPVMCSTTNSWRLSRESGSSSGYDATLRKPTQHVLLDRIRWSARLLLEARQVMTATQLPCLARQMMCRQRDACAAGCSLLTSGHNRRGQCCATLSNMLSAAAVTSSQPV